MNDKTSFQLKIDLRVLCLVLLAVIAGMVAIWRPWQKTTGATTRQIKITGEATVKAVPDEYTLNPYFEFSDADRTKASEALTKQSNDITVALKKLGVKDEQITSSSNAYDKYQYQVPQPSDGASTLQLSYTIKVGTKELAQKVQDYLVTLNPKGSLSPIASFSEQKSKSLEAEAREKALADAKQKAEKTAQLAGAKLGKVITISDGSTGPIGCSGGLCPMMTTAPAAASDVSGTAKESLALPIQPGQQNYTISVTVEYEIK